MMIATTRFALSLFRNCPLYEVQDSLSGRQLSSRATVVSQPQAPSVLSPVLCKLELRCRHLRNSVIFSQIWLGNCLIESRIRQQVFHAAGAKLFRISSGI